ncbi:MAG TPA: 3-oxoacyl-[acyl-carrier-protein] synthase III C-terminal domain-containing protein [Fibrobacteria bacterium]|nr:3-oxoacyl-[acyl-carrier-protein] synthase III C-terminal domain-containing protein [Fibrobacteria bacterium]
MADIALNGLIGDFRILRPRYAADHAASVRWLSSAHAKSETVARGAGFDGEAFRRSMERYVTRFGCGPESLANRGHDLEDFLHLDWERMRLFNLDQDPRGAGMSARMDVFSEIADRMLEAFYPADEAAPPGELIHVTCTGYAAPSAAQKLVMRRGWQERTGVLHAYHMGCYASMPALRMATACLASPRSRSAAPGRVDIVHSETCTLHLDPSRHIPEQLVVQSLFSDGHIRYSVRPDDGNAPKGLRFLGVHEEIIPGSLGAMGWSLGDRGMKMLLAREVPELIAGTLKDFLRRLFDRTGADPAEAFSKGVFAVHPGGPRIIDKVAELLELRPGQVAASRAALKAYGNMSSATLPHVWAALLADAGVASGTLITSLAFGPGLTVYGAMLRKA